MTNSERSDVYALSLPQPLAWLVSRSFVDSIPLVGVGAFPLAENGVIIAVHANPGWDEGLAGYYRSRADAVAVPSREDMDTNALVALAEVEAVVHTPDGWFVVPRDVHLVTPPHHMKAFGSFEALPDKLATTTAAALRQAQADAAREEAELDDDA